MAHFKKEILLENVATFFCNNFYCEIWSHLGEVRISEAQWVRPLKNI